MVVARAGFRHARTRDCERDTYRTAQREKSADERELQRDQKIETTLFAGLIIQV